MGRRWTPLPPMSRALTSSPHHLPAVARVVRKIMFNAVFIPGHGLIAEKEVGLMQGAVSEQSPPGGECVKTSSDHEQATGSVVETMENSCPEPKRPVRPALLRPQA